MAIRSVRLVAPTGPDLLNALSQLMLANAKRGQPVVLNLSGLRAQALRVVNEDGIIPVVESEDV